MYAAPELSSKNCYSESVDVWGVGVLALCILDGIETFQENKPKCEHQNRLKEVFESHLNEYNEEFRQTLVSSLNVDANRRPTIFKLKDLMD